MPLASQYLLLVLHSAHPRLKCSLWSFARLSTLLYVQSRMSSPMLLVEVSQYLSLCCARFILLSIPSIQIQPLKLRQNFDLSLLRVIVQVLL